MLNFPFCQFFLPRIEKLKEKSFIEIFSSVFDTKYKNVFVRFLTKTKLLEAVATKYNWKHFIKHLQKNPSKEQTESYSWTTGKGNKSKVWNI